MQDMPEPSAATISLRTARSISLRSGNLLWATMMETTFSSLPFCSLRSCCNNLSYGCFDKIDAAKGRSLARYLSNSPRTLFAATSALVKVRKRRSTSGGPCMPTSKPSRNALRSSSGGSSEAACCPPLQWNSPAKGSILWTLDGSFSSSLASNSPAATMLPALFACLILPASVDFNAMIIFIASNSTYGSSLATSAPSLCK
mmetsp:Transcript_58790/g.162577  ORF Transcript_58790/g.162577 Transcript_58790/m.162577 type:complete len:201 (-) Transcript_58790:182-784(-)